MPFLTLEDPNAKIQGSRDPLGLQPLWSAFGRHLVVNLTTVTGSVRGFTVLILGRYIVEQLVDEGRLPRERALDGFLRFEQMAGYARHLGHGVEEDIRGIERVRRFAEETRRRPEIQADSRGMILSDQKTYGLWGLFSVAARVSGLIADGPVGVTTVCREFIEAEYVSKLQPGLGKIEDLVARGGVLNAHRGDKAFDALCSVLTPELTPNERAFYARHLRDACSTELTIKDRQQILAMRLAAKADLEAPTSREELGSLANLVADESPELAHRIRRCIALEALLAPSAVLFNFLLARPGQALDDVAEDLRERFGPRLPNLTAAEFEPLLPEIAEHVGTDLRDCAARTRAALHDGDYKTAIETLLRWNEIVMRRRGSAAWVRLEPDGRLDVRYRESEQPLPGRDEMASLWRNTYFIDSLKAVTRQLEAAA